MSRYADFVLAVSGELSAVAEREVDASIDRALGQVGTLAHADRAYVFLRSEDGLSVTNTHEWCAEGVTPAKDELANLPLDRFPWAFTLLDGTAELVVPLVANVPPSPERVEWDRENILSLFCTPLVVHGECVGFIGCDWVKRTDPLDAETTQLIRVAGSLIAGAVSRRRAWRAIEYRSRFEELVLRISSRFINLRPSEVGGAFTEALESLGRFIGVESGVILHFTDDGHLELQHIWRVLPLVVPPLQLWTTLDVTALVARLRSGEIAAAESLEPAPPEYAEVRSFLEQHGVRAVLSSALVVGGKPWGLLGFSTNRPRRWSADDKRLLQLSSQVFANALSRVESDRNEARLQDQLRQTQKLDVVGQLAGGIAHDFNNLLVSITLWSELARRNLERSPADAREAVEEISRAAERAATLTQQLLTFSRQRPAHVRPLSLEALVGDMFKLLRRLVRESIRIELALPPLGVEVEGDPAQLEQVLLNLCVNASDAMPDGGTLTIAARVAELLPRAEVPAWVRPGPHVVLEVADTGVGIPRELVERIFEPFFTTKPPGKGTGLGLSTVYGIVRQHRGQVRVQSQPGVGTRFEVWLPRATGPAEAAQVAPQVRAPGGTETVLLAEDDPLVRSAITEVLTRAGYRVLAAADGTRALELFDHDASVAIAVVDAVMPGKSGLDTWRALHERRANLPVLFTSGYSSSVFPAGFFDDGSHQLLEKPFHPDALLARLRALLAKAGASAAGKVA